MKIMLTPQFLSLFITSIFLITYFAPVCSLSRCLEDQKILLLKLKDEFRYDPLESRKLVTWNENEDCCSWEGVGCDDAGHVIRLELDSESIFAGLENSTSLFTLHYLEKLNLAFNCFNDTQIPRRLSNLKSLTHLNLSTACFVGQVPVELSTMTRLVSFDLSDTSVSYGLSDTSFDNLGFGYQNLKLENPDLTRLVQNLTEIRELYLDGVNISAQEKSWCQVLSSSFPNLRELSLRGCYLSGPIDSSLSQLHSLSILRLDNNNLSTTVPRFFANFSKLMTLSLAGCSLRGFFPRKIFLVPTLQKLDLSSNLLLSGALPQFPRKSALRTLVLSSTNFSDSLPDSIGNLTMLSRIELFSCKFSGKIPSTMTNLTELVYLDLSSNFFTGSIPHFHMCKKLTHIDLYDNRLTGSLRSTNFSDSLPDSISNLTELIYLDLSSNLFTGPILQFHVCKKLTHINLSHNRLTGSLRSTNFSDSLPDSISNLTELIYLDLSSNLFTGSILQFHVCKKLTHIDLSHNRLTGSLSSAHFEASSNLEEIYFGDNMLSGNIPSALFVLPSLQYLLLSNNQFDGQIEEIPNPASSHIETLDLSSNKLEGRIPEFLFKLEQLTDLSLSFNFFSGTFQLEMIRGIRDLTSLDLSYNNLAIDLNIENSNSFFFPELRELKFASCKLKEFPETLQYLNLEVLDLSANQLKGEIPAWIWEINNRSLHELSLSFNQLTSFEKPYSIPNDLYVLDLSFNQLHGELPIPPNSSIYLDYSNNKFNGFIPTNIGNHLYNADFFSVSSNNFTGVIPTSICMSSSLQALDLSNNSLNGSIPSCLTNTAGGILVVLNLGMNRLSGNIPNTFSVGCSLKSLYLSQNLLTGKFPGSLVNCSVLEVLNIANNRIEDTFPCILMNTNLRVLVLQSNRFHGEIQCPGAIQAWPKLQIIDISVNNFTGALSPSYFSNWQGMMNSNFDGKSEYNDLRFEIFYRKNAYYQDFLTVTIKGAERELKKILIAFTAIDFSRNKLNGKIPDSIGDLKSLHLLNLSSNDFTETIPASIGNLTQLESLDLSRNLLTGKIPQELASLTFLEFLNLSFNGLSGPIPSGNQFNTISEASYKANAGLCGFPLSIRCKSNKDDGIPPPKSENEHFRGNTEIDWVYIFVSLGFATGLGMFALPLLLSQRWRDRYFDGVDSVLIKIFHKQRRIKQSTAASVPRNQIRRL